MPEISFGSEGKAVKIWQIILGISADGLFGGKTQGATKEWQKRHGLEVDGIVGPKTWAAAMREL
jgi:peptidoglycan hydrolase-like protein with peptidoglycan-binding domain